MEIADRGVFTCFVVNLVAFLSSVDTSNIVFICIYIVIKLFIMSFYNLIS